MPISVSVARRFGEINSQSDITDSFRDHVYDMVTRSATAASTPGDHPTQLLDNADASIVKLGFSVGSTSTFDGTLVAELVLNGAATGDTITVSAPGGSAIATISTAYTANQTWSFYLPATGTSTSGDVKNIAFWVEANR